MLGPVMPTLEGQTLTTAAGENLSAGESSQLAMLSLFYTFIIAQSFTLNRVIAC